MISLLFVKLISDQPLVLENDHKLLMKSKFEILREIDVLGFKMRKNKKFTPKHFFAKFS